jgi:hypothetical protein
LASSVEPELKLGTYLHVVNSFMGCNQIWRKVQESTKQYYFLLTFLAAILHQFARKDKKRLILKHVALWVLIETQIATGP